VAACFFLSGASGLIYEVLWARMLGLVFGATTLAVSTVLAAFMGGLALGSAWAGRVGDKVKRPVRAYGLLEIGIRLFCFQSLALFAFLRDVAVADHADGRDASAPLSRAVAIVGQNIDHD
jgi:spermidine synthase